MKKIFILALLIGLPFLLNAQLQVGPAAIYNFIMAPGEIRSAVADEINDFSLDNFSFGADARLKLGFLQFSGLAIYNPGDPNLAEDPHAIELFLDAGVAFDFLMLRLGAGLGPNIHIKYGAEGVGSDLNLDDPFSMGANLKFNADVMLGRLAISASYLMLMDNLLAVKEVDLEGSVVVSVLFGL